MVKAKIKVYRYAAVTCQGNDVVRCQVIGNPVKKLTKEEIAKLKEDITLNVAAEIGCSAEELVTTISFTSASKVIYAMPEVQYIQLATVISEPEKPVAETNEEVAETKDPRGIGCD